MNKPIIAPPATFSPDYKSASPAPRVPSALSPSEVAAPSGAFSVTGGSNPVSSAEGVDIEVGSTTSGRIIVTIIGPKSIRIDIAWAKRLRDRLDEAIRQAELTIQRQPESNIPVSHAPSAQPKSQ